MELTGYATPRPMTHDLMARLLEAADAQLERVHVASLREEVFYAVVKLRRGDEGREVDARPSDAIALALRTRAPIYATDEVLYKAGKPAPGEL